MSKVKKIKNYNSITHTNGSTTEPSFAYKKLTEEL